MLVFNRYEKLAPVKKKRTFSLSLKYAVVNKAYPKNGAKVSLRSVAREFNVQPTQIRKWKKVINKLNQQLESDDDSVQIVKKMNRRSRSIHHTRGPGGGGKFTFGNNLIKQLKIFYDNKRQLNESVGTLHLRNEACKIDPTNLTMDNNTLRMRIYRLFKLWNVSYRRATHKAQNTKHCQLVIKDFQEYVKNKISMLGCKLENVYNADQTNVYFSLESVYTYADTGSRTVSVKACDSNQRCTVMLSASVTGEKVIPYIVYKGKNTSTGLVVKELKKRIGYPKDVEMTVQEHAWFDEVVMLDWIERVWRREVAVSKHDIYYLLLDSCTIHMTAKVRKAFCECNTEVDFIPPGYTSKLQMLDVGVNRPFKIGMRNQFDTWICENTGIKPTRRVVAQWIENAWGRISSTTILNSWTKSMEIGTNSFGPIPSEITINMDDDPLQTPMDMGDDTETYVLSQETMND
jgi:hypothetical protein